MRSQHCYAMTLTVLALAASASDSTQARMQAGSPLVGAEAAQSDVGDQLTRPEIDQWIFLGATVGHGPVSEDGSRKFGVDDPGLILITQMDPGAYDYFKQNKRYSDGTTFAVSFYSPHAKPEPEMDGVALGDLKVLFVHKLERDDYGWQHAFYVFRDGESAAKRMPDGNVCVACHTQNGDLDGTFVQFYPVIRGQLQRAGTEAVPSHPGRIE